MAYGTIKPSPQLTQRVGNEKPVIAPHTDLFTKERSLDGYKVNRSQKLSVGD